MGKGVGGDNNRGENRRSPTQVGLVRNARGYINCVVEEVGSAFQPFLGKASWCKVKKK